MKELLPFLKLFKKQWLMMITGLLLTIITVIAGIGLLSLSGWFLSATAVAGLSIATAEAFNYFIPSAGVRFFSIVRTASRYGERLATHEATFRLLTELRCWLWEKIVPLSIKDLQSLRKGDLLNRFLSDINTLDHLYIRLLTPMLGSLILIFFLGVFICYFDPNVGIFISLILCCAWLILPSIFYYLGKEPSSSLVTIKSDFRTSILDFIESQAELQIFDRNDFTNKIIEKNQKDLFAKQEKMASIAGISNASVILLNGSLVIAVFFITKNMELTIDQGPIIAMLVFTALASVEVLVPISLAFAHLNGCINAAIRINEITNLKPSISYVYDDNISISSQTNIELKNVNFAYENATILQNLNFEIKPLEKVAILGKTGAGKSTVLQLLSRQLDVDSGEILLSGHPIGSYSKDKLSSLLTIVPQRIDIFSGTLKDNLRIALIDELQIQDATLIDVLEQVGLNDLIKDLNVELGDGGRTLSGGERRRMGIARALLRDTNLVLLDEPTEALDPNMEKDIIKMMFRVFKDKTVIMVSHKLETIKKMDRVFLLEHGKMIYQK